MGCFQTKRLNCAIVKEILNERRLSLTRRAILIKILNGENMEEIFICSLYPTSFLFEIIGIDISNSNNEMYVQSSIFRSMKPSFRDEILK